MIGKFNKNMDIRESNEYWGYSIIISYKNYFY